MGEETGSYNYDAISNKVIRKDKRLMDQGSRDFSDIDTNPHSLKGIISAKDFGSKIQNNLERNIEEKDELQISVEKSLQDEVSSKKKKNHKTNKTRNTSLAGSNFIEILNYIPTTQSNKNTYTKILSWCSLRMDNDVPDDVIESLADIIIELLKQDSVNTLKKKSEVVDLIKTPISDLDFEELYELVDQISDYKIIENERENDDNVDGELGLISESNDDTSDDESSQSGEENSAESEDNFNGDDSDKVILNEDIEDHENIIKLNKTNDDNILKLDTEKIDKTWLTKQLTQYQPGIESYKHGEVTTFIMSLLEQAVDQKINLRQFEDKLLNIQNFELNELYYIIVKNYKVIYYTLKFENSSDDTERSMWREKMDSFKSNKRSNDDYETENNKRPKKVQESIENVDINYPRNIDLNSLVFTQGSKLMTVSRFELPEGTFKRIKPHWEEIHVPPPKMAELGENELLVSISQLPEWAQTVFPSGEMTTLNRIQSKVFPAAFNDDCNLLMCAPTGAGKTNVAMLTVLKTLSNFRTPNGKFQLSNFKIVYIAPLKALVQEQVREFDRRLSHLGITVSELTGDSNLTKHQIESTQILVTTPEKWDVITRKSNDASYINLVKLVIIDEIHLLHDERGPVIESIVSRSMRQTAKNNENNVRFVGLSATLPNYKDVAQFLRVKPEGLFYFDSTYRPCPLAQQFIGITEKKAFKKLEAMNEVCYEKILENLADGNQVIVFVHSRKDTVKTAKWLANKLVEEENLSALKLSKGVREILRTESENATNKGLKSVLSMGFGIHHAGMNKDDRQTSEDLFAEGHIKILVSTATLAWGVNLPAHTVIIKGTSIYSPQKGAWVDLSPQDILQMLGRAGRPRYDTHGDGIIITSQDQIKYYLAVLNQQLPIESQMYSKLPDSINAEIVSGSIKSLRDCVDWMGFTYLYIRMLHSREVYFVGPRYDNDPELLQRRKDLSYSALLLLSKNGLIRYNFEKDIIIPTDLGKIASYYYISYMNMKIFEDQLKQNFTEIELFRLFATSEEFKYVPVRREEKLELKKLVESAPIPINEDVEDPLAKINVLLQAYITGLKLDGFAIMADMIYISQSAGRLFRALYDLATRKKWAKVSRVLLNICKTVEKKMWLTSSPLRQYPDVPASIIQVSERSLTPWKYYLLLDDPSLVAKSLKAEKFGNLSWELIQKFPQLKIDYSIEPITPSLLQVHLDVIPFWKWDSAIHGYTESFTLLVEDCDGEKILYKDQLSIKKMYINKPHFLDFTVPIVDNEQPNYFVSLVSEKWLFCETKIPIILTKLKLPKKYPAPTPLIDMDIVPITELGIKEFTKAFTFENFNKFQSQAFDAFYNSDDNILFSCSKGNGKTTMAILSLLNHWKNEKGRAIYILPNQTGIDILLKKWKKLLSNIAGGKTINKFTGEINIDLQILAQSHLILCTPEQIEIVTRRWQQRKSIQSIELVIADDCHFIGANKMGTVYEMALNRFKYMNINMEKSVRFVVLGSSLASYKDFADWINIPKKNIFVFDPREKIYPVEIKFEYMDITHNPSFIKCMVNPSYNFIKNIDEYREEENVIAFVSSRKELIEISKEYIRKMKYDESSWLQTDIESLEPYLNKVHDSALKLVLEFGIGYLYENMASVDQTIVLNLFNTGILKCLLATKNTCYWAPQSTNVLILGTKEYEGKEHRYIDYSIIELLEMVGLGRRNGNAMANIIVYTNSSKIEYYKRFVSLPLPLESHLNNFIHDALISDIKLIKNRQYAIDWITYSLFYRRLQLNPSFYKLADSSENGLSEYLSEFIETSLHELESEGLIELNIDDDENIDSEENGEIDEKTEVIPLNGCMIANYYNISYATMQTLFTLNSKSKLKKILEVVCCSQEFEELPIREHESNTLFKLYNSVPLKWNLNEDFESTAFKAFILLQAYFSRIPLGMEHKDDLNIILPKTLNLLNACVDILSSQGSLNAMLAMDISQMIVQGMWNNENVLKQIPYFGEPILKKCKKHNVETLYDFMDLEDDQRDSILEGLNEKQIVQVADFVNRYPNLEITYKLVGDEEVIAGESKNIEIEISRDEEALNSLAASMLYPAKKFENWWVVIGNKDTNQLYSIKKLAITKEHQILKMDFTIPEEGKHDVYIWCVCDSYIEADKQVVMKSLNVKI